MFDYFPGAPISGRHAILRYFFIGENDHRKSLKPFYDPMIRATDTPSHLFHIQSFVNLPIFLDRCR